MDSVVSVVIPARNAGRALGAQLTSLTQSCGCNCEIIVVDNMSTDDTAAVAAAYPGVQVLSCPTLGASAARNCGIRATSGDKILVCDADDVVSAGWYSAMSAALDSHDVVGGPLDWDTLNDPFVRTTRKNLFEHELPLGFGIRSPIGANMGFRRAVFDAIDGFDEAFMHGADETDFCYRASAHGFTIGFVPDAVVAYRLRSNAREAARQSASYTSALAQFRAKHAIHQPWKSKVLRTMHHCWAVASIWRCLTRAGRFEYAQNLASARAAVSGYRRYGIMG